MLLEIKVELLCCFYKFKLLALFTLFVAKMYQEMPKISLMALFYVVFVSASQQSDSAFCLQNLSNWEHTNFVFPVADIQVSNNQTLIPVFWNFEAKLKQEWLR